ncbi:MAG: transcriptional activator of cad operon [Cognaticolwellia sp.]|jgi:transcriptional activator of cad operon
MAVLMLLVEAEGEVVSQEVIFAAVWPNSIFSQSSVQRCIALLRKSLADDAKRQAVIVTHPKRGYSLTPKAVKLSASVERNQKYYLIVLTLVITIAILLTLLSFWLNDKDKVKTQVVETQLISATDDNESKPQFLSEQYLSYIRHEENKGQAIWIFDLLKQHEIRVTPYVKQIGSYQWFNQNTLLYTDINAQKVDIFRQKIQLENIHKNNHPLSNKKPILSLFNINIFRGFFLTRNNYIIYQSVSGKSSQLRQYNLGSGQDSILVNESEKFKPYGFTVNNSTEQIVIIGFNELMKTEVKLLELQSEQLTTIATLDTNIYQITWQEKVNQLLLTQGKKLLNLTLSGEFKQINYKTAEFFQHPSYSPNGKFIAFTQLKKDSDLWLESINNTHEEAQLLVNSTASDYAGSFSSSGEKISYISNKMGFPQIYVKNIKTGSTEVVFNNPERKLLLSPPIWHPSKDLIVSSVNAKLLWIDPKANENKWRVIEDTTLSPVAWYQDENTLLVTDYFKNKNMLSKYDLARDQLTALSKDSNVDALLDMKDNLIKVSQNSLIELRENIEYSHKIKSGNIVAAISTPKGVYLQIEQKQTQFLTFYDFNTKEFSKHKSLSKNVFMIWDIQPKNQKLLFETSSFNQDIILIELN